MDSKHVRTRVHNQCVSAKEAKADEINREELVAFLFKVSH